VLSNFLGSVSTVMTDAISAIGLQIAIYYGLAGLAVVVTYRRVLLQSVSHFLFIGLWPFIGAVFMFVVLYQSVLSLGGTIDAVGMGAMALGLIPMAVYWVKGSPYFRQRGGAAIDAATLGMAE
jgi:hypothetical protein